MIAKSTIAATLLAASITSFAFASTAHAAEPAPISATSVEAVDGLETMTTQVRYGDLDLASAQGQSKLDARLRQAARKVCSVSYGAHPLSDDVSSRKCYGHALNSARQTLASAQYRKVMSR